MSNIGRRKVQRMGSEMKPCPFCGNMPTIRIFKGKDGWRDRYAVLCRYDEGGCGAESGLFHSEAEAVVAWNMRAETVEDALQDVPVAPTQPVYAWADVVAVVFKALLEERVDDSMSKAMEIVAHIIPVGYTKKGE